MYNKMDNKKGLMGNFDLRGQIEVRLEDRFGGLKKREIVDNTITDAYLKYVLYDCMTLANLVAVTRATASGSLIASAVPNKFGIYAMSEPIVVNPDTYLPPYVDESRTGLHPSVSFYNVAGATTEASQVMIPVDTRCFYDRAKLELTMEYVKNTYAGTVRSIAIGRDFATANLNFSTQQKDVAMPADFYSTTANYVLEHTANDGTIVRKPVGTNELFTVNLKTKLYSRETNATGFNNVTTYFGALAMNGHLFKVAKKSASGSIYTVTLTYLKDYLTAANTAATLDIAVPTRENMSVNTTVVPVLVSRASLNKLEVFITMSTGNHGGQIGANVKKVVVDVSDIDNITYDVVDMGVIKYAISGFGTVVGQYYTGLYHNNKYYLPYYYVVKPDGTAAGATVTAFQEGVVMSSDFSAVLNVVNVRFAANSCQHHVITDTDEVIQMWPNLATPYVVRVGQLISGANLENPITKGENDVLRLIYKYRIS
jgi:hypothetical protein